MATGTDERRGADGDAAVSEVWSAREVGPERRRRRLRLAGVLLIVAALCTRLTRYGIALVVGIELVLVGGWYLVQVVWLGRRRPDGEEFTFVASADVRASEASAVFSVAAGRPGRTRSGYVAVQPGALWFFPVRGRGEGPWVLALSRVAAWTVESAHGVAFLHVRLDGGLRLTVRTARPVALRAAMERCLVEAA